MFTAVRDLTDNMVFLKDSLDSLESTIEKLPEGTEKGRLLERFNSLKLAAEEHEKSTNNLLEALDEHFS